MSDDLATWLLENIAEVERRAHAAADSVPTQESVPVGYLWTGEGGLICGEPRQWADWPDYKPPLWDCEGSGSLCMPEPASQHAATWDPKRVLAECDAKRRIVEQCQVAAAMYDQADRSNRDNATVWLSARVRVETMEHVIKVLALPYADRPGYREEWRP